MFRFVDNRLGHYALLLLAGGLTFFTNLGGPTLWDVDEGRNATAAYEMMESTNWVVPTFNAQLRTDKPVLLYWLQIAAYRAFGVNEFAARFPSALAALLTVLLTYELGRFIFGRATGLLAGLALASCVMVCAAARFANPDALLNLCTVLTLGLFWCRFEQTGRYPFVSTSAAAGLGVLAKGPVGLVLPLAVCLLYLCWVGRLRALWSARLFWGALTFGLVALPWYGLVGAETKAEFLRGFLFRHNVERFLSPLEDHGGGVWYYPAVLLVGLAPWSCFLLLTVWFGFWSAWRADDLRRLRAWWAAARDGGAGDAPLEPSPSEPHPEDERSLRAYRFLWCWVAVYLAFFTLAATKLPNYVLPLCAPMAVLTARLLDRWRLGTLAVPGWAMRVAFACFALAGAVEAAALAVAAGLVPVGLRAPAFPELAGWASLGLLPVAGAALAWWCERAGRRAAVVGVFTAASLLFVAPLAAWGVAALNPHKPARPLVEGSGSADRHTDLRIGCYQLIHLPSLNFYCQRTVSHLASPEEVARFLQTPLPVYLFLPEPDWEHLRARVVGPHRVLGRHRDLYKNNWVVVVSNR